MMTRLFCYRISEGSSSPRYCDAERIGSATTSTREMTSVRTCYCKHERDVPCRKDNDVGTRKEKRQLSTASRRSLIKSSVCRNSEESRKMRSAINEKAVLNVD